MVSSSCNHEMLTPIRCIISIVKNLLRKLGETNHKRELDVVLNTATFLLNQVQGNLDQSMLDQNRL